jgi:uncharacterized protein YciI
MKQFLYRLQVTRSEMLTQGPTAHEAAVVGEHFEHLKGLFERGVVMMAGRTTNNDERTFGIVVFLAKSEAEAATIVQSDPAVKNGIMKAEFFPFHSALWSHNGPPT